MKCVYQIFCIDEEIDEVYIGSTDDLTRRKDEHKCRYIYGSKIKLYEFMSQNGGISNFAIVPIEIIDFPIYKIELKQYEQGYLDIYKPQLNCNRAYSSAEDIKESSKQNSKKWRAGNKDHIKKYKSIKGKCPHCNKEMLKHSIKRHIRDIHPSN